MKTLLEKDRQAIQDILTHTVNIATTYYDQQQNLPPSLFIKDQPFGDLPEGGLGAQGTLDYFSNHHAKRMANSAGPRYFGFVTGGATPASVAGDWLVSVYDQVMSGSNDSVAHFLERQTIHFLLQLFGLHSDFTGTFVTGATMSNFVSLATARQWIGEQHGVDISETGLSNNIPVKILSASPHSSTLKSLSMLGLGRKAWVKIDTLPDREAISVPALEQYLKAHPEPAVVVANAGTVNTVDFDDLQALAELKKQYKFWLHVDAAFGGFAAVSPTYQHLVKGLNDADSITIDAHKWMNVPYDAAMQFTKHRNLQINVFKNQAAYLGDPSVTPDSMHITPENSRRFRALPAWFSLMAYGRDGYRHIIERNCEAAKQLGNYLSQSNAFKLLAPVRMNVVCFTFQKNEVTMEDVRTFLNEVRDDGQVFFSPTLYKGTPAIRAAISNWQTTLHDVKLGFEVLSNVYEKISSASVHK